MDFLICIQSIEVVCNVTAQIKANTIRPNIVTVCPLFLAPYNTILTDSFRLLITVLYATISSQWTRWLCSYIFSYYTLLALRGISFKCLNVHAKHIVRLYFSESQSLSPKNVGNRIGCVGGLTLTSETAVINASFGMRGRVYNFNIDDIGGLTQQRRNSSAVKLGLRSFCNKLYIYILIETVQYMR